MGGEDAVGAHDVDVEGARRGSVAILVYVLAGQDSHATRVQLPGDF